MIIKCTVAYDGYNYAGWQKQENALGIQTIIEEALEKIQKSLKEASKEDFTMSFSYGVVEL